MLTILDSSCSQAFDKPTDSESQTDFDKSANDISINVNAEMPVDNRTRESQEIYCREHHCQTKVVSRAEYNLSQGW